MNLVDPFGVSQPVGNRRTFERLPGGGYAYTLIDDGVRIELRYLRRERGQLYAEVDVQCDWAGAHAPRVEPVLRRPEPLQPAGAQGLAKYCARAGEDAEPDAFDWLGVDRRRVPADASRPSGRATTSSSWTMRRTSPIAMSTCSG